MTSRFTRLSQLNYEFVQKLVKENSAIQLETGKEYLVETRLSPIAKKAGFKSLNDFVEHLQKSPPGSPMHAKAVEALTTNETSFFRDNYPFETLRNHILPKLLEQCAPKKCLNIWSAASSTGQEPYSVAILLKEHFSKWADWNISILATDLSPTVLEQAEKATYSDLEVSRGLPPELKAKYFTKKGGQWILNAEVRKLVQFRPMNLIKPWPILPLFDLILIRNVLIYFDVETKKSILKKIRLCLQPNGYMMLGGSETTMNLDADWQPFTMGKSTVYQPAGSRLVLPIPMAA